MAAATQGHSAKPQSSAGKHASEVLSQLLMNIITGFEALLVSFEALHGAMALQFALKCTCD